MKKHWIFKKKKDTLPTTNPYENIPLFIKKEGYPTNPLIEAIDIAHYFKTRKGVKEVYDHVNFEIFENERLAFLGPNGAGKTLTISTLCGIFKVKEGTIKYNFDYTHTPYEKLSVQFQDLQFPSSLTPRDLIAFTLKLYGREPKFDNDAEILEGLDIFGITSILDTKMSKLSGGQQQRVNVFIAMLGQPKVLFLDEFTTGIDIAIKNRIQKYILSFCDKYKISLVIISHDLDCIQEMVNRVIILADKRIIMDAPTDAINKEFGSVKAMLQKYIIV